MARTLVGRVQQKKTSISIQILSGYHHSDTDGILYVVDIYMDNYVYAHFCDVLLFVGVYP
jgi:hypothetical protein